MAKSRREVRGSFSTSENIYLLLATADISEKSLANFPVPIYKFAALQKIYTYF